MSRIYQPSWQQQSPVALDRTSQRATFSIDYLSIDYPNQELAGHFREHNFWFDEPPRMSLDGRAAQLVRLHVHAPAEHVVLDETHQFEIHFVNEFLDEGDSKVVVIGAFFKEQDGAATADGIRSLDGALRSRAITERTTHAVNPWAFLPATIDQFFRYEGSLTTAPFDQDVSWVVLPTVVLVDPPDVQGLKEHAEDTARPLQPLDRRFVLRNFGVP